MNCEKNRDVGTVQDESFTPIKNLGTRLPVASTESTPANISATGQVARFGKPAAARAKHLQQMSDSFMRDAQREENSLRTRADLAFEAVYLWAASSVNATSVEHPNPIVLTAAAKALQLTDDQISPALTYAMKRYSPSISDEQNQKTYDSLLTLAQLMRSNGHV
jgi:hypothetical protein